MRQIVLDTETTGLEAAAGHRIIELGCVELVNRRFTQATFHEYINPERQVDAGALEVHGLDNEFLKAKPKFDEVAAAFVRFVEGAELVIHNAAFDVGFVNHELRRISGLPDDIRDVCTVLDTLSMARKLHPGQRNSLDALAKRYEVDNSRRELHGALLDAEILAGVYLAMTGGQVSLSLDGDAKLAQELEAETRAVNREGLDLVITRASSEETAAHELILEKIRESSGAATVWEQISGE